ncbi:MAG: Hpt domain-containing protein [Deltaproteobacteria bacterium]|nr:Hpt domain-containing protein [Deltaproteobacteria bacterium]
MTYSIDTVRDAFGWSLWTSRATIERLSRLALRDDSKAMQHALCVESHRLAGTASSLGFTSVGQHAAELERALESQGERWHGQAIALSRALDAQLSESPRPIASLRLSSSAPIHLIGDFSENLLGTVQSAFVHRSLSDLATRPQGVCVIESHEAKSQAIREARDRLGEGLLMVVIEGATTAQHVMALRAGADLVGLSANVLDTAQSLLPGVFAGQLIACETSDALMRSVMRAGFEALGARLVTLDESPTVVIVDDPPQSLVPEWAALRTVSLGPASWANRALERRPSLANVMSAVSQLLDDTLSERSSVMSRSRSSETFGGAPSDLGATISISRRGIL